MPSGRGGMAAPRPLWVTCAEAAPVTPTLRPPQPFSRYQGPLTCPEVHISVHLHGPEHSPVATARQPTPPTPLPVQRPSRPLHAG